MTDEAVDQPQDAMAPATAPEDEIDPPLYGSIFVRIVAFLVDAAILAAAAVLIIFVFGPQIMALGSWARIIGSAGAVLYFGVLQAGRYGGQTPGKRLAHLRVVRNDGRPLSLPHSLLRALLLVGPLYLFLPPVSWEHWAVMSVLLLIGYGIPVMSCYLLLFNRGTKQVLHDFFTDTIVVDTRTETPFAVPPIHWAHLVSIAMLLLMVGGVVIVVTTLRMKTDDTLNAAQTALRTLPHVTSVEVASYEQLLHSRAVVSLSLHAVPDNPERTAQRAAQAFIEAYPRARTREHLTIELLYGYDLGVFGLKHTYHAQRAPAEWLALAANERRAPSAPAREETSFHLFFSPL